MKVFRAGLVSAVILASGCISPGKVDYGEILESGYHDPKPSLIFEKRKTLGRMDFNAYLPSLEGYLRELNEKERGFDRKEFETMVYPFHTYLETLSSDILSLDHVVITEHKKILPKDYVGKYDPLTGTIYLLGGELSMQTLTHEFGHHTDMHRNFICTPSSPSFDLCKEERNDLRVRAELVADAFQLYVASDLAKYNRRLALFFAFDELPYSLEGITSFEGLMEDLDVLPAKRYLAADIILSVLYTYQFKDFKKTWDFVRRNSYKTIFSLVHELEKKHGDFKDMAKKGSVTIEEYFVY